MARKCWARSQGADRHTDTWAEDLVSKSGPCKHRHNTTVTHLRGPEVQSSKAAIAYGWFLIRCRKARVQLCKECVIDRGAFVCLHPLMHVHAASDKKHAVVQRTRQPANLSSKYQSQSACVADVPSRLSWTYLLNGQIMPRNGSTNSSFITRIGGPGSLLHHGGLHVIALPALHLHVPATDNPSLLTPCIWQQARACANTAWAEAAGTKVAAAAWSKTNADTAELSRFMHSLTASALLVQLLCICKKQLLE